MNPHDESRLAEHRHAFLRLLPRRVEAIGRRLHHFLQEGWDINGLALMHEDAEWLGAACRKHGIDAAGEHFSRLHALLGQTLQDQALPDPALGERLWHLIEDIGAAMPVGADLAPPPVANRADHGGRGETPPANYWRRWGDDAPPAKLSEVTAADMALEPEITGEIIHDPVPVRGNPGPAAPEWTMAEPVEEPRAVAGPPPEAPELELAPTEFISAADTVPAGIALARGAQSLVDDDVAGPVPDVVLGPDIRLGASALADVDAPLPPGMAAPTLATSPAAAPAQAPLPPPFRQSTPEPIVPERKAPMPTNASPPPGTRIYHLTDHGPLSLELDQRMEAAGYEVELLDSADELQELLGAYPAHVTLVDASFSDQLENVGMAVRAAAQRVSQKCLLVAISQEDDINLRLAARRAGVDSLLLEPTAGGVLKRLGALLDPGSEQPYRVLIVEDDRSQAMFAESILRNAGMETEVVLEALEVLQALQGFQPDLVLMDLHMPNANGIELTTLIRDQEQFLHTPIVFLSGESDEETQFDALDAGGDDFISKPVRPRHLISAVQNRVRRHRALEARRNRRTTRIAETGLFDRDVLLESLEAVMSEANERSEGGVLFLEIESVNLLRDRLGLTALEQLLTEVGKLLVEKAGPVPGARFGDGTYVLLDTEHDEAGLEALAAQLRGALVQHPFQAQGHPLRLRVSVGVCALRYRFPDVAAILNAVERVAREARTSEKGVRRYEPAKPTEEAREAALVKQIREAIALNKLELLFQPVVAVAGSDDSQYQVLLRLRGSDGKLLPAAEVVPLAERGDFIDDIDRWVLQSALKLIRDRRLEGRPLRLFVTQSALTLSDPAQATWLKAELAAHDVPGTAVVIELRLEDAATHAATVRQFCDAMVADGVQFCLSQFEAGTESERLLDQLPLSFIKLARKYTTTASSAALRDEVKVLIERAHRHGLEVIGHGVEDAQAAATLWMSGIDFIQGNLVQQAERSTDFDFQQAVL
ncbi:EAL domain-containing protein [Arenimonas composti]|uniref:Uncharacterized protein n=1 Tax=Arenimonas composti TR7-09 = DSM 18010 TaxID=1121013 RepID=A0A091BXZ0_9GAMM|nr:EAL domain-containing response regulator [Arenimonas composti]KFN49220.1 hypothetical protein P873_12250 [Arenimonas composti TR7-09 = DSM 18010]